MDWSAVTERIERGEGPRTEFKRGAGDLSAVGKAICAFANTVGGLLVLGIADSREVVGVRENPDTLHERLASFLQTGCSAPVHAQIGRRELPEGWVFWIEVPRQRGFEPMRHSGRVWVRRDRTSVEPSASELQELYNAFGYVLTEERAILDATPSHIDLEAFRAYLKRMHIDTANDPQPDAEDDLRNRAVVIEIDGKLCATLYGVMAFGRDPQRYRRTSNFRIECAAYAGSDRASETLQVASASGRINEQVERAVGWFMGLGHFESYENLIREDRHLLPRRAIREALANAVTHRDYAITGSKILLEVFDDRVDVTSPGALPNHMTVERVRAGANPRSRNEYMAHFMAAMGFVEQRGRGWLIMRSEMRDFNGTEPDLVEDKSETFVRVTFHLGSRW
ncbi:MAG: putative DNA binding domain-containing protein [Gammaproteobacteria bacterium]|nr:putative DNA binding domain-containing protein [Gammaproteobacteria bacterium]MDE2655258.1 putative DNA binding domain-containing protein [Gemmatimonadota bacterium]MXW45221.1 transcriptional regulator [Gammaproteobacteria bacterium]MYD01137.1 transcriptional regulator [Gammaproteobacteria bacterium]MYI24885.1 transcriptional regulator [Gammaproteobacteria bacterium]